MADLLPWYFAPAYLAALALLAGAALRDRRMILAASILLGDWYAATMLADATGSQFEWAWLGLIDSAAAWLLVLSHRRMEAVLSGSYAVEVLIHISYGINKVFFGGAALTAQVRDWWILFSIACLQAVFLMVWRVSGGGGSRRGRSYRDLYPVRLGNPAQGHRDNVRRSDQG